MPFCTQCGGPVGDTDRFCGQCGAQQQAPGGSAFATPPPPTGGAKSDLLGGMSGNNAAALCYIPLVGWIVSIIVLASDRYREEAGVRFHAFQGLYLFVLYLFVDWVFGPFVGSLESVRYLGRLLKLTVFGTWIFMLIKTMQGQMVRLPILGELAERSVAEQK
jgi:uncharacterized membrane protein